MNDTTLLLGLPGVVVDRVDIDADGTRVVHVSTLDTRMVSNVRGGVHVGEGVGLDRAA
jgi:hypothetical protein